MRRWLWPIALLLIVRLQPADALQIARAGEALLPIVTDGTEGIDAAVADLQRVLGEITGAEFSVIEAEQHRGGPAIFVGATGFRPSEADQARERWTLQQVAQVQTREESLHITGGGTMGCTFAVYAFLEDVCGVRFFHPGELGTHVPHEPDLAVEDVNLHQVPSFMYRRMWPSPRTPDRRMYNEWRTWYRRSRQGGASVSMGHNLFRIVPPELYDDHPDYFPLIGGVRVDPRSGAAWQPELANPGVIELAVQKARAAFDANADSFSYSLSMNDSLGWSASEEALAQDPPEFRHTQDRGKARRMLVFANAVAEEVAKTHPDRCLVFYAYKSTLEPPDEPAAHPNVIPAICHWGMAADPFHPITAPAQASPQNVLYRRAIDGWGRLAGRLIAREYWTAPRADPLLKAGVAPILFEDIPYYHQRGFIACSSEANIDWGNLAINHYVAARLMWDVARDPEELLQDYFAKYYGAAAEAMREYFTRIWAVAYRHHLPEERRAKISDEDVAFLDAQLRQAADAAAGDRLRAARVSMARDFFDTWRMQRALSEGRPSDEEIAAYMARLDALADAGTDALVVESYRRAFMAPIPEAEPYAGPELEAALPGGPIDSSEARPLIARRGGDWLVLVGNDRRVQATVMGVRVGAQYAHRPSWRLVSSQGEPIASGHTPLPGSAHIDVEVPKPGLYQVRMNAGANGCGLVVENGPAVMVGPGFRLCEWPGQMYFWVPEGTDRFTITLFAGKGESALMRIFDPSGTVAFEGDSLARDAVPARVTPAPEHTGRAWAVEIAQAPEGILEDYQLLLGEALPPYLATSPQALLVPAR